MEVHSLRQIAIATAIFLISLPGLGQQPEVVFERVTTDAVQISTAADSPNVTRVTGNVTINYYICSYVLNCGPSQTPSVVGGYQFAVGSSQASYSPPTMSELGFNFSPRADEPGSEPWILNSLRKSGDGLFSIGTNITDASAAGMRSPEILYPSAAVGLDGIGTQVRDPFLMPTSVSKFASTSYSFAVTTPSLGSGQSAGSDSLELSLLVGAAFSSGQVGTNASLGGLGDNIRYSDAVVPLHVWRDADTPATIYPIATGLLPSAEAGNSNPAVLGDLNNLSANSGLLGNTPELFLSQGRYSSTTGSDVDSLTKQLAELAEQKRTVVGWTILTEKNDKSEGSH